MKLCNLEISAENQQQADAILNALLEKKVVTGGQFIQAPARFLWKGEVVDMDYITITSFTVEGYKQQIIDVVEAVSAEEVPMVRFTEFEGNAKLDAWITETLMEQD